MRFYKMQNGDIVTNVRLVMDSTALKAIRVFDKTHQTLCFEQRVYRERVKERLNTAQSTVLQNKLDTALKTGQGLIVKDSSLYSDALHTCVTIDRPPYHAPEYKKWIAGWGKRIKESIHDYTK